VHVLIATTNPGKIREFREMLGSDRYHWSDLSQHPGTGAVEETGTTFRANACLKAAHYARLLGMPSIADDSGLEVDALGRSPGVYSARWAEMNGAGRGDADNNRLLLQQLAHVPDERRTARFVCVLALADPHGSVLIMARDTIEGRIVRQARGDNGFGYDPLFLVPQLGRTTAELSAEQKHAISHRGKALRRLREMMDRTDLSHLSSE
jgi:XTP/dITP diphosphohydrolase